MDSFLQTPLPGILCGHTCFYGIRGFFRGIAFRLGPGCWLSRSIAALGVCPCATGSHCGSVPGGVSPPEPRGKALLCPQYEPTGHQNHQLGPEMGQGVRTWGYAITKGSGHRFIYLDQRAEPAGLSQGLLLVRCTHPRLPTRDQLKAGAPFVLIIHLYTSNISATACQISFFFYFPPFS